jgi:lipopolysaccharide transport system ATP-binding protein
MGDSVIRVEGLGKKYLLSHQSEGYIRYNSLREVVANGVKSMFWRSEENPTKEEFWALRDVNFEIRQGDRVGIMGRNGAGKSTLLKLLSRIVEPTTGRIGIRGRVASLLEVGTGFHPELTGRENIFLNGAILGMSRREIDRKFDEIVAFAEVEKFLDTPVKRYSSGMYVRLAFAVAAHLEPEVLIVDEVLAVGDAQFQKKCLGKMEDVGKEGRTVIFVSHNMAAIEKLCETGIVLNQGQVQLVGSQREAIAQYLTNNSDKSVSLRERSDRQGSGAIKIVAMEIKDEKGNVLDSAISGQAVDIYLYFEAQAGANFSRVIASLSVKTQSDIPVFLQHNRLTQDEFGKVPQSGAFICRINHLPLPAAIYNLDYSLISDGSYLDMMNQALDLSVIEGDFYGSGEVPPISHGVCLVDAKWRIEPNGLTD